jgi:hypothetical protein
MAKPVAFVTITRARGRTSVDSEVRATSLDALYQACRDAPPSKVARISIRGPQGEVRLNFASFIHASLGATDKETR